MGDSPRKYVSNFSITLNVLTNNGIIAANCVGALYPVQKSEAATAKSVNSFCPTHGATNPTAIKVIYKCPEDPSHGPFEPSEVLKGKLIDGQFAETTKEEAAATKASTLPKDVLELVPYNAEDVSKNTYPIGTAYLFVPHRDDDSYKIVGSAVRHLQGEVVFVGLTNLRNAEKLVALIPFGNGFVVQQLAFPEHLNHVDVPEPELDQQVEEHLASLIVANVSEFEPDQYKDTTKERMEQMLRDRLNGAPMVVASPVKASSSASNGLLAAIQAAATATPAKAKAAKKATKKVS